MKKEYFSVQLGFYEDIYVVAPFGATKALFGATKLLKFKKKKLCHLCCVGDFPCVTRGQISCSASTHHFHRLITNTLPFIIITAAITIHHLIQSLSVAETDAKLGLGLATQATGEGDYGPSSGLLALT